MTILFTCPKGHRWEGPTRDRAVCPKCGKAAVADPGSANTEALTFPPTPNPGAADGRTEIFAGPLARDGERRTSPLDRAALRADPQGATLPPTGVGEGESDTPEDLTVPGYQILEEIGRGGMGVVYRALQIDLHRPVALKMILAGAHAGPQEMARFSREAEAVARLQHPNIVQIYDVGEHDGRPFLALEYVSGGTLAERQQGRPLRADQAAGIIEQLARAVQYAHDHGIVHRDLKPANILLASGKGQRKAGGKHQDNTASSLGDASSSLVTIPKIADFGLAKQLDSEQGQTQSGALVGTPSYMAPEQASGSSHDVGPPVDIYALGAILYELLTGRPPFVGETPLDTVLLVVAKNPVPPRLLAPKCPRDLETICLRCLQKKPKDRYATAQELADDLARFRRGEPVQARRQSRRERIVRWVRRRPVTAACVLVGLSALVWAGFAYGSDLYRLATNRAEVVFASSVPGVRVRIQPADGEEIAVEVNDRAALTLPAGKYTLSVAADPRWLELSEDMLTLTRNGREEVRIRLQPEGEIRRLKGHTGTIHEVAVAPNGRLVLSVSGAPEGDKTARIWSLATGKPLLTFQGHNGQVMCGTFSPDSKYALTGGTDRMARVWDVELGQECQTFFDHANMISTVSFSRDGRRVLTAARDGSARLYDRESGQQLDLFDGHAATYMGATFTPDDRQVVTVGHDNALRVWDIASGTEVRRMDAPYHGFECVVIAPDGRLAATSGYDHTIRLWDLKAGRLVGRLTGHTNVVSTLAFAPNGRLLVSGSMDRTVRLWDVASRTEVHCFTGHTDGVRAVAFCPDGRRVVSAGGSNFEKEWVRGSDYSVRVWGLPRKLATPAAVPVAAAEVRRYAGHEKGVLHARVAPDGKRAVSASLDGTVRLWDLTSGQEYGRLVGHTQPVTSAAWSADGGRILTGDRDGAVRLWDARTGRKLACCLGHTGWVWDVALSADGRRALSGGGDGTVRLWDLASGQELCRLTGHAKLVRRVALTPDGLTAVSCSAEENDVRVWELRDVPDPGVGPRGRLGAVLAAGPSALGAAAALHVTRHPVRLKTIVKASHHFEGHSSQVRTVVLTPDGKRAISGGNDRLVRIWDLQNGQELKKLPQNVSVESLQVSADGKRLLAGDWSGAVICWDLESGREVSLCSAHPKVVTAVNFVPGGRFLSACHDEPVLRLWQMPDAGKPAPRALEIPPESPPPKAPGEALRFVGHRNAVTAIAFTRDGQHVLTGSGTKYLGGKFLNGYENELRLWDARTGREVWRRKDFTGPITRIAVSPNGQHVLTAGSDRAARLWTLPAGQLVREFPGHTNQVRAAVWSPDGQRIATAGYEPTVRVFEAGTGRLVRTFPPLDTSVWGLAFSPDRRRIAAAQDKKIRLGDLDTGQWLGTLEGHTSIVRDVFFSADGTRLISCGNDGRIRQYDVARAKPVGGILTQKSGIIGMALSRDGRYAVTGAWDGQVRLWDLHEKRDIHTFAGHGQPIHAVAFAPDGRHVVSGGFDNLARLWAVPDAKALAKGPPRGKGPGEILVASAHPEAELLVRQNGKVVVPATTRRRLELPPGEYEFALNEPAPDLRLSPRWVHVAPGGKQEVLVRRVVSVIPESPELVRRLEGHGGGIRYVAFSPDGRLAISASGTTGGDNTARVWDVATGKELRRLEGHLWQTYACAISPDGRHALTGGADSTARLWELHTGREVRRFVGHLNAIWHVAFNRKGDRVITSGPDRTARVWETATGKELLALEGHRAAVEPALFSPDGKHIVTASMDRTVRLWDAATGREVGGFTGFEGYCRTLDFSPDGKTLLAGCGDGTLRLWDMETRKELKVLRGHKGRVLAAAFAAGGRRIVSTGLKGIARVWDVATGNEVCQLAGHTDVIFNLAVSPDGRYCLSAGGFRPAPTGWTAGTDFDIRLWRLPE